MTRYLFYLIVLGLMGCTSLARELPPSASGPRPATPSPFRVEVYAKVPGARHLALGPDGTLFVGTGGDKVYALPDKNHDFKPDSVTPILEGLNRPNGVAVDGRDLVVAEIDAVRRYPGLAATLKAGPARLVLELPKEGHHGARVVRFGPDGALYVTVGVPANVGEFEPPYGTILRLAPGQAQPEVYARGIRNSMGLDWDPQTGQLWFSDNGRDWLGDDLPPEEVNHVGKAGEHFGFPYFYGKSVTDPELGAKAPAGLKPVAPAVLLQAHVAPLGMRFYRGKMFPPEYRGKILLATHGSWNRSSPVGYEVLCVDPKSGARTVVVGGWLQKKQVAARPVDVEELSDGSIVISSDHSGQIFRATYGP